LTNGKGPDTDKCAPEGRKSLAISLNRRTYLPLLYGLLCAGLAFSWQALKVRGQFGGNWTGLFDTGKELPSPPELASENIIVASESTGYDGQFYHYVAHDPFFRHGLSRYVDNPRMRYGRILVPLAAYLLAAGNPNWIDPAVLTVILFFIFLGACWLARFALQNGRRPESAFLFLLLPATILSIETLTVDVALVALCAGFALMQNQPAWKLMPILALAPLVRETGLILIGASISSAMLAKSWRQAALFALTAIPWLAWAWFVHMHTEPEPYTISGIPLSNTLQAVLHLENAVPGRLGWILTLLAIFGSVAAIGLGLLQIRRTDQVALACVGFSLLGVMLQRWDVWQNFHAHTRLLSPLYMWLAVGAVGRSTPLKLAPLVLVVPRFLLHLLPQIRLLLLD
jgi:hypothetical protein